MGVIDYIHLGDRCGQIKAFGGMSSLAIGDAVPDVQAEWLDDLEVDEGLVLPDMSLGTYWIPARSRTGPDMQVVDHVIVGYGTAPDTALKMGRTWWFEHDDGCEECARVREGTRMPSQATYVHLTINEIRAQRLATAEIVDKLLRDQQEPHQQYGESE